MEKEKIAGPLKQALTSETVVLFFEVSAYQFQDWNSEFLLQLAKITTH